MRRPSYQDNALNSYFASHDPGYKYYEFNGVDFHDPSNNIGANGGLYNRIGRGLPDVSSNGAKIDVVFYGVKALEQGTSCSAPTWGSIVTLINEKRTQAGKGPVGFINPVLYEHPEVCKRTCLYSSRRRAFTVRIGVPFNFVQCMLCLSVKFRKYLC